MVSVAAVRIIPSFNMRFVRSATILHHFAIRGQILRPPKKHKGAHAAKMKPRNKSIVMPPEQSGTIKTRPAFSEFAREEWKKARKNYTAKYPRIDSCKIC